MPVPFENRFAGFLVPGEAPLRGFHSVLSMQMPVAFSSIVQPIGIPDSDAVNLTVLPFSSRSVAKRNEGLSATAG